MSLCEKHTLAFPGLCAILLQAAELCLRFQTPPFISSDGVLNAAGLCPFSPYPNPNSGLCALDLTQSPSDHQKQF
jgi:hypothetical protein